MVGGSIPGSLTALGVDIWGKRESTARGFIGQLGRARAWPGVWAWRCARRGRRGCARDHAHGQWAVGDDEADWWGRAVSKRERARARRGLSDLDWMALLKHGLYCFVKWPGGLRCALGWLTGLGRVRLG